MVGSPWLTWFIAAAPPCILGMILTPLVLYKVRCLPVMHAHHAYAPTACRGHPPSVHAWCLRLPAMTPSLPYTHLPHALHSATEKPGPRCATTQSRAFAATYPHSRMHDIRRICAPRALCTSSLSATGCGDAPLQASWHALPRLVCQASIACPYAANWRHLATPCHPAAAVQTHSPLADRLTPSTHRTARFAQHAGHSP